jgi:hypothetical protein
LPESQKCLKGRAVASPMKRSQSQIADRKVATAMRFENF